MSLVFEKAAEVPAAFAVAKPLAFLMGSGTLAKRADFN